MHRIGVLTNNANYAIIRSYDEERREKAHSKHTVIQIEGESYRKEISEKITGYIANSCP